MFSQRGIITDNELGNIVKISDKLQLYILKSKYI